MRNSKVCMAGMANVFAHALSDWKALDGLPERFRVRIEAG